MPPPLPRGTGPAGEGSSRAARSERFMSDDKRELERLVEIIKSAGVSDASVLAAMGAVRRSAFVPAARRGDAYGDHPLPIGEGQTISQPTIVAIMAEAAQVRPGSRVLEVGTGSGYGAAVLAALAGKVDTIERHADLAATARANLEAAGVASVTVHVGDGTLGLPERAPFDAIVVTAGGPNLPQPLVDQLAPGGRLVMPIGPSERDLWLAVFTREADGSVMREDLMRVAFVRLVGRHGWTADD